MRNVTKAFSAIVVVLSLSSVFLSKYSVVFDLFSHFQLQYLFAIAILILICTLLKDLATVIPLGVYGVFIIYFLIFPLNLLPEGIPEPNIFFINSNYFNTETSEISEYIGDLNPATVVATEINPQFIAELKEMYGDPAVYHNDRALSCAIFTKRDLVEAYVLTDLTYPICVAQFQDYTLYAIHPMPPLNQQRYKDQKEYFSETRKLIAKEEDSGNHFVLVGDFNSTYYSGQFREYFGKYFQKNIYTWATLSPFTLPIDHALSNRSIRVTKSDRLSSDHNGLIVDF